MNNTLIFEETKATSKHQITIPQKIWDFLNLKEGTRFTVKLLKDNRIFLEPRMDDLSFNENEWEKLHQLVNDKGNVGHSFKSSKEAIAHLKKSVRKK